MLKSLIILALFPFVAMAQPGQQAIPDPILGMMSKDVLSQNLKLQSKLEEIYGGATIGITGSIQSCLVDLGKVLDNIASIKGREGDYEYIEYLEGKDIKDTLRLSKSIQFLQDARIHSTELARTLPLCLQSLEQQEQEFVINGEARVALQSGLGQCADNDRSCFDNEIQTLNALSDFYHYQMPIHFYSVNQLITHFQLNLKEMEQRVHIALERMDQKGEKVLEKGIKEARLKKKAKDEYTQIIREFHEAAKDHFNALGRMSDAVSKSKSALGVSLSDKIERAKSKAIADFCAATTQESLETQGSMWKGMSCGLFNIRCWRDKRIARNNYRSKLKKFETQCVTKEASL